MLVSPVHPNMDRDTDVHATQTCIHACAGKQGGEGSGRERECVCAHCVFHVFLRNAFLDLSEVLNASVFKCPFLSLGVCSMISLSRFPTPSVSVIASACASTLIWSLP